MGATAVAVAAAAVAGGMLGTGMVDNNDVLGSLNSNLMYDISKELKLYFLLNDPEFDSPEIPSEFFDSKTFIDKFKNSNRPLYLSLNVQSLMSKFSELKSFINLMTKNDINLEIIALQETWDISVPDLVNIPGYSFVSKNRKNQRGGGVGFYVKSGLVFKVIEISPFEEKFFECISIEVVCMKKRFIVSNIYRTPSSIASIITTNFISTLENHLSKIAQLGHMSYIFLDSNINMFKLNDSEGVNRYFNAILTSGFKQVIKKATRMQGITYSLIDHVLVNSGLDNFASGTLISDISDHFFTFISPDTVNRVTSPKTVTKRNFSDNNINNFKNLLRGCNWNGVLASNNVDTSFEVFWSEFKALFDLCFPETTVKFNKNVHKIRDFMTKGLLISRCTKLELYKKSLKSHCPEHIRNYRNYRNLFNSLVRLSKKMYFDSGFCKFKKNPKKTWDLLKEATFGSKNKIEIKEINLNGSLTSDQNEISGGFNEFFTSVGKKIFESVEPVDRPPDDYQTNYEGPKLDLGTTGPIHTHEIIQSLITKSSQDIDGISTRLLKNISIEISVPLSYIFNLSLETGYFPEFLKVSRTVPIHKGGDVTNMDNYRPISLIKTFSKVLEKMVSLKLTNHLEINKLIHHHQYGFQAKKSTEQHLIHVTNFIGQALNNGEFCVGIFLDFKKAFDTVSHSILLKKLKKFGIDDISLKWFASYLNNRKQCVDVNGNISSSKNIDISVLQGSILGPILFLCFINDLPNCTILSSFLFADDTAVLASHKNIPELVNIVNSELQKITNWLRTNRMAINVSKTKFILFRTRGKKIDPLQLKIFLNTNEIGKPEDPSLIFPLERVHTDHANPEMRTYKLLGIHFDEYLSFDQHVSFLCAKLAKMLFCIKRAVNYLTENSLKSLYVAFIQSNLLYCSSIVGCTSKTNIQKIVKIQKKAIRVVTKSKYNDHTSPLFLRLNLMNYENIISYNRLVFMHSIEYNYAPTSFNGVWPKNTSRNNDYNLRNNDDFTLKPVRIELFKRIPLYSFALEWNSIGDLKLQHNKITFQIALKYYLINETDPPPPSPPT